MKIYKENEKSKALCTCCGLVTTTFQVRDVPVSGSEVVVSVLAGVCDKCDAVVTIPHQSAPKVKEALLKEKKPVEARIPRHFLDILTLASSQVHAENFDLFSVFLVRYYIRKLSNSKTTTLSKFLDSDLAKSSRSSGRISFKIGVDLSDDIDRLLEQSSLTSRTDLIKAVILKINSDVVEGKNKKIVDELKDLAVAV